LKQKEKEIRKAMVTTAVSQREGGRERTDRAVIHDCIRNGGRGLAVVMMIRGRRTRERKRGKFVRFRFKLGLGN
jgi:hypothetical protein